jgi:methionine biosynthesis protein MetW
MEKVVAERYWDFDRAEMAPLVPTSARRVLDIGCANGRFLALIKERQGAETWGIEINPEAAGQAAGRVDRVIRGDVDSAFAQLPDGYFDCVVCNDVLEHLPDPSRVLRELASRLSAEGVIVASIPNMRYLPVLYELLFRKDWRYRDSGVLDRTHLRFFTRRSIVRLFADEGYRITLMQGLQVPTPRWYKFAFAAAVVLTLGFYNDTRFIQFACVAAPVRVRS